ncbi:MAG: SDR family oxidoreductase [Alphaproteobacteria bacterium]|nr:SDR family oxidoreductase [Alphaproteobacteria bacterium]
MDLGLRGKVALITAGSLGLGKAIAEEFGREGARVAICARRAGPLEETRVALAKAGVDVLAVAADMTKPADIARFVQESVARFGRVDILVNNAGDAVIGRKIDDADAEWQKIFDVTLWSAVRATREVVPHLRQHVGGSIINIASVSGHSGLGGMADYNAAKAAMLSLTKTLAQDLAPDHIRVNAVNPALVRTPLWERMAREVFIPALGNTVDEVFEKLAKQNLLVPRFGRPEEVSCVVALLASDRASFITGACWNIDGGFTKFIT